MPSSGRDMASSLRAGVYAGEEPASIGGPKAQRPIAQITLLGGLASTIFWPLGHLLAEHLGWRGALLAYAGIALLTLAGAAVPTSNTAAETPGLLWFVWIAWTSIALARGERAGAAHGGSCGGAAERSRRHPREVYADRARHLRDG